LVEGSLSDPEVVWCLSPSSFDLVTDAAVTLGIDPVALANDIRLELTGALAGVLSLEKTRSALAGEWDAWYALRPDYFIRSCQAAFKAFGGNRSAG
jgi:hypothetical protein